MSPPEGQEALEALAEQALADLFAYMIREDHDPDHSAPEDAALDYAAEIVSAAIALFHQRISPCGLPPNVISVALLPTPANEDLA
jgi:hypothetical protein